MGTKFETWIEPGDKAWAVVRRAPGGRASTRWDVLRVRVEVVEAIAGVQIEPALTARVAELAKQGVRGKLVALSGTYIVPASQVLRTKKEADEWLRRRRRQ